MGFASIYGQQLVVKALQRSLASGEIGHAYLFSGPSGSGKRTLALLFAQALNCLAADPPCGKCLSCRKSKEGNHPDLYWLLPEGASLKIEQLREIKKKLYYLPVEGSYKICVLEASELLTVPAANSLLKILEDPPQNLVFMLLAARPWALLPTVLSRSIAFALKPLPPQDLEALLAAKTELLPPEKKIIYTLSQGNPGQALDLAEKGGWQEKFAEAQDLLHKVEEGPADGIFSLAEELGKRKDLPDLLEVLLIIYRDRLVSLLGNCDEELMIKDRNDGSSCVADSNHQALLNFKEKILDALLQLQGELRGNVNRRLALEALFLQMRGVI